MKKFKIIGLLTFLSMAAPMYAGGANSKGIQEITSADVTQLAKTLTVKNVKEKLQGATQTWDKFLASKMQQEGLQELEALQTTMVDMEKAAVQMIATFNVVHKEDLQKDRALGVAIAEQNAQIVELFNRKKFSLAGRIKAAQNKEAEYKEAEDIVRSMRRASLMGSSHSSDEELNQVQPEAAVASPNSYGALLENARAQYARAALDAVFTVEPEPKKEDKQAENKQEAAKKETRSKNLLNPKRAAQVQSPAKRATQRPSRRYDASQAPAEITSDLSILPRLRGASKAARKKATKQAASNVATDGKREHKQQAANGNGVQARPKKVAVPKSKQPGKGATPKLPPVKGAHGAQQAFKKAAPKKAAPKANKVRKQTAAPKSEAAKKGRKGAGRAVNAQDAVNAANQ